MKRYTYFPGCSSAEGGSEAYGRSAQLVGKALGAEFAELEDWNCCGSTPSATVNELGSLCMAARNLALAEKQGTNMVTPCSACYVILNRTNDYIKEYPRVRDSVDEALAAGGLEYHGGVRVRHVLDALVTDIGYENIKSRVTKRLDGLKVAPYYGCQMVRPGFGFDNRESPQSLDKLVSALGGTPVDFPLKSKCCGGSLIFSEEGLALDLIHKLLTSARDNGAECIITACPLCQTNLDAYQGRVNKKFKEKFDLPVLFFTQLIGLSFGLDKKDLGLEKCIVSAKRLAAKYA
jgi:heterodisulfide reductase subunit B